MTKAASIFADKVPTGPDVRMLIERYGVPAVGTLIPYGELEELLHCQRDRPRFYTVTHRWRAHLLRDHNVATGCDGTGVGIKVLSPDERVSTGRSKTRGAVRMLRRATNLVETTDRAQLSAEMRAEADHLLRCNGALLLAARMESRRFQPQLEDKGQG
jgi:hypothetical protein